MELTGRRELIQPFAGRIKLTNTQSPLRSNDLFGCARRVKQFAEFRASAFRKHPCYPLK